MDRFETLFNLAEAVLWSLIALAVGASAFRHAGKKRRILSIAALAFAVFGVSDWIEAETGSWWEPWWLLTLKVACVAVLLLSFRAWQRLIRTRDVKRETPHRKTPERRR